MKTKSMPAQIAPGDTDDGTFEAIVSVFNNKDLGGDIVRPGAFEESLDYWKSSGDPIPVYWSHRMDDPMMNIGQVSDAVELVGESQFIPDWANDWVKANGGLYIKAAVDDHTPIGAQVRHLMKTRRVKQFSFSYDVLTERRSKDGSANELLKLWLHEIGPTPLGMNPLTELISAKAAEPDPPPNPDTGPDDQDTTKRRSPSALFLRLQADFALAEHQLAD